MAKGIDDYVLDASLQSIHEAGAPPRGERPSGACSEARREEKRSFQNNLSNGSTAVERTPAILADTYLRIHV